MARIYTRSGDKGTTALIGGQRVAKDDPRVEAYGTVDELAAHIALLTDMAAERGLSEMVEILDRIAVELMNAEAVLALGEGFEGEIEGITPEEVARLESEIDSLSSELPPFRGFTIPGGHPIISQCHVCRTVCRRAERRVVSMGAQYAVDELVLRYINRLSDLLYTLSRWSTQRLGVEEKLWQR